MAGNTRAITNEMVTRQYFRQFVVDQSAEPRYPRRIRDWWWNCDKKRQEMRIKTPPIAARLRAENSSSEGRLCGNCILIPLRVIKHKLNSTL